MSGPCWTPDKQHPPPPSEAAVLPARHGQDAVRTLYKILNFSGHTRSAALLSSLRQLPRLVVYGIAVVRRAPNADRESRLFSGSEPLDALSSSGPLWPSGAGVQANAARVQLAFESIRLETKRHRHSTVPVPADGAEGAVLR